MLSLVVGPHPFLTPRRAEKGPCRLHSPNDNEGWPKVWVVEDSIFYVVGWCWAGAIYTSCCWIIWKGHLIYPCDIRVEEKESSCAAGANGSCVRYVSNQKRKKERGGRRHLRAHISVYLIYQRARRAHVFDNGLGLCSSAVSTLVATR
jgi:hypothetical protein